jgi:hypothetical protein
MRIERELDVSGHLPWGRPLRFVPETVDFGTVADHPLSEAN